MSIRNYYELDIKPKTHYARFCKADNTTAYLYIIKNPDVFYYQYSIFATLYCGAKEFEEEFAKKMFKWLVETGDINNSTFIDNHIYPTITRIKIHEKNN